jgi:hypothetical protein
VLDRRKSAAVCDTIPLVLVSWVLRFRFVLYALLLCLLCLLAHEAGHVLAGVCFGAKVSEFVWFGIQPHVRFTGPLTAFQAEWASLAGSAAELLLFLAALIAAPRNSFGRLAVDVFGLLSAIELIGWAASALAYPNGPRSNDVWKFISLSGTSPASVFFACCFAAVVLFTAYRVRAGARP